MISYKFINGLVIWYADILEYQKFSGDSQGDSDSDDDGGMPQCQQS